MATSASLHHPLFKSTGSHPGSDLVSEINSVSWWHRIPLEGGIITPGLQDSNEVIPHYLLTSIEFKNKSVLGYGCKDGLQLFWAEALGAEKIVALEESATDIQQNTSAQVLARLLGSKIEFTSHEFHAVNQAYDIVLAYDSINTALDPVSLIEHLCSFAKHEIVFSCHFVEGEGSLPFSLLYQNNQPDGGLRITHAPNYAWLEATLKRFGFSITHRKIWQTEKVRQRITLRASRIQRSKVHALPLAQLPLDTGQEDKTAILVMSCARFKQVWDPFFKLFARYWPDCPYKIYFCSDVGHYPGISSIEVGEDKGWASNCLHALRAIDADRVILFQEDFLLMSPVSTQEVRKLVRHSRDFGTGCLRLFACPGPTEEWGACKDLGSLSTLDTYRLSLQLAVWNRSTLMELLVEGETPWQTEMVGTNRAALRTEPFLSVRSNIQPVPYYCTAVVKGEWQDEAIELLKREGISTAHITKIIPTQIQKKIPIPPKTVPEELRAAFTLNGKIPILDWYIDQSQSTPGEQIYTKAEIDVLIEKAKRREINYYGETDNYLYSALDAFPIKDKSCAIMGSQIPWYESIALSRDVRRCVVIEYQPIRSTDARIEFITPDQYSRAPFEVDVAFCISSFEHDGLGRYGDPINPMGDLEAMSKVNAMLKPGGLLFLAVPVGKDKLVWNAHRIYGAHRLPLLLQGWELVGTFGFSPQLIEIDTGTSGGHQPVFVLKKKS